MECVYFTQFMCTVQDHVTLSRTGAIVTRPDHGGGGKTSGRVAEERLNQHQIDNCIYEMIHFTHAKAT